MINKRTTHLCSIRLNLRCWIAARIQAKMNAPYKARRREISKTSKNVEGGSPSLELRSRQRRPDQERFPDPCESAAAPSKAHQQPDRALFRVNPVAGSTHSSKRAQSDDSGSSFSFRTFLRSDSEEAFSQATSRGPERLRTAVTRGRSQTKPCRSGSEALFTPDVRMLSGVSTNVTTPDVRNVDNSDIYNGSLFSVDQIKQTLQVNLTQFLLKGLDYTGVLLETIPPIQHLYEISPYRELYSDLEIEFRNFNRALNY